MEADRYGIEEEEEEEEEDDDDDPLSRKDVSSK